MIIAQYLIFRLCSNGELVLITCWLSLAVNRLLIRFAKQKFTVNAHEKTRRIDYF